MRPTKSEIGTLDPTMDSTPLLFCESVLRLLPVEDYCYLALLQEHFGFYAGQFHAKVFFLFLHFDNDIERLRIEALPCLLYGHGNCKLPQFDKGLNGDQALDYALKNLRDCRNVEFIADSVKILTSHEFLKYVKPIKDGNIEQIGIENLELVALASNLASDLISGENIKEVQNLFLAAFASGLVESIGIHDMTNIIFPNLSSSTKSYFLNSKIEITVWEDFHCTWDNHRELAEWTDLIKDTWNEWINKEIGKRQFTLSGNPTERTGVQWIRDRNPPARFSKEFLKLFFPKRHYRFQHKDDPRKVAYMFVGIVNNAEIKNLSEEEGDMIPDEEFMALGNFYSLYLS
ncbi:hypothetical protein L596_022483 [Steinernema carpocapsae]|uniref:Uncharacterized protein n=1 Tax=Steinernema carpocapsae TaxID=34508 RepID=A0A4U5MLX1_STECR|nr:hypothetical protein L596_022483 [Steinernema carpocapsae]